ncbi:MAG: hypothetical protein WB816_03765 [Methylocystis sp.]
MIWLRIFMITLCAFALDARADVMEFPSGAAPIDIRSATPIAIAPGEEIVVRGVVSGETSVTLVLRIDDGRSSSYATRVNEEHELPPGPFDWRVAVVGIKTSNGGLIDARDIRRVMLFETNSRGAVQIDRFGVEAGAKLPDGSIGYSLGFSDAQLIAGLTRLSPNDPRIIGRHPVAVRRPGLDPVVSNGVVGIERLHLEWPRGRARISLWTEDVGEWENLPRVLRRRIRVNGVDILDQYRTPRQWIVDRYLAGRDREAGKGDDAWNAYGRYRGGLISAEVEVGDDGVSIEFAGDTPAATFLSAAVIEPAERTAAREMVEAARRAWIDSNFPVRGGAEIERDNVAVFDVDNPSAVVPPVRVTLTPGSGARAKFALRSATLVEHPDIAVRVPSAHGRALEAEIYAAQQRLERQGAGSRLLTREARLLRGEPGALPIRADEPRRYETWISAPEDLPAGVYRGAVDVALPSGVIRVPIVADVLPIVLPIPVAPAGFYLDEAPHLGWSEETRSERGRQLSCDLLELRKFGIVGNAPGLATPTGAGLGAFVEDVRRAADAGARTPLFAYTPLKRLLAEETPAAVAPRVFVAMSALERAGLPAPIWSITDEPGNPDQGQNNLLALAAKLRADAPGIRLGGQFNNPRDIQFIDAVDTVLINQGFGIDADEIMSLRRLGREVWLYNTGKPRFTAGVWLWLTDAAHYLQWHARMPSADPFDPTDGREGDVQIFPPMPEICPLRADIDINLLDMAEGLVDQRWLAWLSGRNDADARALETRIRRDTPRDWKSASADGARAAQAIRNSIIELARRLK